jgi:hypothetical protein
MSQVLVYSMKLSSTLASPHPHRISIGVLPCCTNLDIDFVSNFLQPIWHHLNEAIMVTLQDLPFVSAIAEWIWGGTVQNEKISPDICLSQLPLLGMDCFKQLLSKCLGLAIIGGSMLNKLPIMINMWSSQSASGISRNSL